MCDLNLSPDCEIELQQTGAILFSPTADIAVAEETIAMSIKYHWCYPCFTEARMLLAQETKRRLSP